LNHYEIINEYNGKIKYDFLPKIIDKCLEMEHVENAIFSILFIEIKHIEALIEQPMFYHLLMKIMKQLSAIIACLEKYL